MIRFEDLNQIPVNDETRPDDKVVDLARAALKRNQKKANERDLARRQCRPDTDPPEAA